MDRFPYTNDIFNVDDGESEYSPSHWNRYFDKKLYIDCSSGKFCVYTRGTRGTLLILLHGAGHSALAWAVFCKAIVDLLQVRILAIDLRYHGDSTAINNGEMDVKTVAMDCAEIVENMGEANTPKYIFGHSFGGCVGVGLESQLTNVLGLGLIDVVEGTAKASLASMKTVLDLRPQFFNNINQAIRYMIVNKMTHNKKSAKVSAPGQMRFANDDNINCIDSFYDNKYNSTNVCWRVDLYKTCSYWPGWFEGLSKKFLSTKCAKLLVIAGDDRLDKDLLVAQMSGLYQLEIIPNSGHCIQEDEPQKLASIIHKFILRNGT